MIKKNIKKKPIFSTLFFNENLVCKNQKFSTKKNENFFWKF